MLFPKNSLHAYDVKADGIVIGTIEATCLRLANRYLSQLIMLGYYPSNATL